MLSLKITNAYRLLDCNVSGAPFELEVNIPVKRGKMFSCTFGTVADNKNLRYRFNARVNYTVRINIAISATNYGCKC